MKTATRAAILEAGRAAAVVHLGGLRERLGRPADFDAAFLALARERAVAPFVDADPSSDFARGGVPAGGGTLFTCFAVAR